MDPSLPIQPNPDTSVASRGLKVSDIIAILFIGEVFAWLLMIIRKNIGVAVPDAVMYSLFIIMPLVALTLLWGSSVLGRKRPYLFQLGKYAAVGFFNTALDFGIINFLLSVTDITRGLKLGILNSISFAIVVTNSYMWNKYWTFKKDKGEKTSEFIQFVIVSFVGLLLTGAFVTLMTKYIDPPWGLDAKQWVNVVKVMTILISLAWNFIGYKFIVFREKKPQLPSV